MHVMDFIGNNKFNVLNWKFHIFCVVAATLICYSFSFFAAFLDSFHDMFSWKNIVANLELINQPLQLNFRSYF